MRSNYFFTIILLIFFFLPIRAQVVTYINGKEVKTGATVTKADLASLQISFKNPKKVVVISGLSVLYVELLNTEKATIQKYTIVKDGYIAIDDFLTNTPVQKKFKVFEKGEFSQPDNALDWVFTAALGNNEQKTIQVKVGLYVVEETGYRQYGQRVQLVEPVILNVPVWDAKNLSLPYLDFTLDKTNIQSSINLTQRGSFSAKNTAFSYQLDDNNNRYTVCTFSSDDYPGMNPQELADDFIHAATVYANQGWVTKFKDYDIEKYTMPWDDVNNLLGERYRLPRLNWKLNKDIKGKDLMTFMEPVEINGLKGYVFRTDSETIPNGSDKWQPLGKFVIYILNHPTNPKLTLVVSTDIINDYKNFDQPDTFMKTFINGIKH